MNNIFYKYRSFDFDDDNFTEKIILNSSLYFAPPDSFNDPFDCNLSFKKDYSKEEIAKFLIDLTHITKSTYTEDELAERIQYSIDNPQEFIKILEEYIDQRVRSKIGILSLSKNHTSTLMWSHYASSYTGLVFEFKASENSPWINIPGNPPILPMPVEYCKDYKLLTYDPSNTDDIYRLLLAKHIDWRYEEEYRIVDLNYQGEKKFDKNDLTGIIFGLYAKEDNIERMINLCKNNGFGHVVFKKAKLIPGKFTLDFEEIR